MSRKRHDTGLRIAELPDGCASPVDLGDTRVLLLRLGDEVRAVSGWCTHARSPLGEQQVEEDGLVECPVHGAVFDSADGTLQLGPACDPLPVYAVTVGDDGAIAVELDDEAPAPTAPRASVFGSWGARTT